MKQLREVMINDSYPPYTIEIAALTFEMYT